MAEPFTHAASGHTRSNEASGRTTPNDIAFEQEITKRHIVDAIAQIVMMTLYMVFTIFRERNAERATADHKDDWQEAPTP